MAPFVALGAQLASSPQDVADHVETVMAEPAVAADFQEGRARRGRRHCPASASKRFVDLSTTGSRVAAEIFAELAK